MHASEMWACRQKVGRSRARSPSPSFGKLHTNSLFSCKQAFLYKHLIFKFKVSIFLLSQLAKSRDGKIFVEKIRPQTDFEAKF